MTIRDELLNLKNTEGFIVCEEAISWAKANPSSELHSAIEWNDHKAAHEYRLHQIRKLIAIHIIIKSLRDILLDDALKELERIQQKYARVQELAAVWVETEKVNTATASRRRGRRGKEDRPAA